MDMERLEYIYTIHMKKLTADGHGVEVTGAESAASHLTKAEGGEWGGGTLTEVLSGFSFL